MTRLADLFPLILVSIVASLILAPLVTYWFARLQIVDIPGTAPHKQHRAVTPVSGGIVLAGAILAGYLLLIPGAQRDILGIFLGGGLVTLAGFIDDRVNLRPGQKILAQILAAGLLIYFGIQVRVTRIPAIDIILTFLWTVGITNAFNFVDSKDGLALGLAGIASAFFMLVMVDSLQPELAALSALIVGASIGAFLFNAEPARMFLGDSGSQLLGFLLAAIGLAYIPAQSGLPQAVSWFTPVLVLGVPVFDMIVVVFSRLRRGVPISQPGTDHTYHRLRNLGFDSTRAVLMMQTGGIMLGLAAFILLDASVLLANMIFAAVVLIGVVVLIAFERLMPCVDQGPHEPETLG